VDRQRSCVLLDGLMPHTGISLWLSARFGFGEATFAK